MPSFCVLIQTTSKGHLLLHIPRKYHPLHSSEDPMTPLFTWAYKTCPSFSLRCSWVNIFLITIAWIKLPPQLSMHFVFLSTQKVHGGLNTPRIILNNITSGWREVLTWLQEAEISGLWSVVSCLHATDSPSMFQTLTETVLLFIGVDHLSLFFFSFICFHSVHVICWGEKWEQN